MSINNLENDGIYPILIVLFRTVANLGKVNADELIRICYPGSVSDTEVLKRLRGSLSRWIEIGLFVKTNDNVQLDARYTKGKKETLDDFANRLPSFCRRLVLEEKNCIPLWGQSAAVTADFVRGMAWLLAQNIYGFPTTWNGGVENKENEQLVSDKKVIQNDTRWIGLRAWARYLGFATGDGGSFQIDPTKAVKDELPSIFGKHKEIKAKEFLDALSSQIPIVDFGTYRKQVEEHLNISTWHKQTEGHLSMSLSLALRRLELDKIIKLEGRADAGSSFRLTGQNYRPWVGFESVIWNGGKA